MFNEWKEMGRKLFGHLVLSLVNYRLALEVLMLQVQGRFQVQESFLRVQGRFRAGSRNVQ